MPNYTSNGLVNSPYCLLVIPFFTGKDASFAPMLVSLLIEVLFLEDDLRVSHLWVGDANDNDATCCIVGEVKTFRHAASANSHHYSTCRIFLWLKNTLIVSLNNTIVSQRIPRLKEDFLELLNVVDDARLYPLRVSHVHQAVRREKYEDATRDMLSHIRNSHA